MPKRVLLIVSKKPKPPAESYNWQKLQAWVQTLIGERVKVEITALPELVYCVGQRLAIYDPVQQFDLADFDLVVFRTVGKQLEQGIAAAHYLQAKGVPFTDSYLLTQGKGKLACSVPRAVRGIPVPQTIYARADLLGEAVRTQKLFNFPFILKADLGKKGHNNFLIHSSAELNQKLQHADRQEVEMIAQEFIPNQGDYRILVLGGKPRLIIKRQSSGETHLTNTSQGGSAEIVPLTTLSPKVLAEAVKAAELERIEIAGVDVVFDSHSGKHYFLEVNRAPQLPTGAFADQKMAAYAEMLSEYIRKPALAGQRRIIGRTAEVSLSEFGVAALPAKVDTGAYRSALHATDIIVKKDAEGREVLHFTIPTTGKPIQATAHSFTETTVRSSNGELQHRYVIVTPVAIGPTRFPLEVSLTNRASLRYPMLLGRKALRGRFVVNVDQALDIQLKREHTV